MNKVFSVEELAKRGNTTSRAIRLYVEMGLLNPMYIGRTMGFPDEAEQTLESILRAKRLGFRLDEIKACQTNHDTPVMRNAIKRIEALMCDAEIEINNLRSRLTTTSQRR